MTFEASGRPATAVTDDNVKAVRQLMEKDPRVIIRQIRISIEIGSAALNEIWHQHLRVKILCARRVPHFLTVDQKRARIVFLEFIIAKFDGSDRRRLCEVYTGDET